MSYVITCDSTCDLSREFLEQLHIPYNCFHYTMEGVERVDDFGESMPFAEFYEHIDKGAMPTTTQISVGEYTAFFEDFLKKGEDILHIGFSSGLSGSFNSATIASKELQAAYPERRIMVIDSLGASSGYGLLLTYAAELRDGGAAMEDVYAWVSNNRLKLHHWFFSTNLKHYRRGGRVSGTAAMLGTALGICPLLNMNDEGKLIPREKIRPKAKAITEIVERMKQHAKDGLDYAERCYISESACFEDARAVADIVEKSFPKLKGKVQIFSIGTVIGSHTGPGTVALFFLGDERVR